MATKLGQLGGMFGRKAQEKEKTVSATAGDKSSLATKSKKKKGKSAKSKRAGLVYAGNLHKTGGKFRGCRSESRWVITAFVENRLADYLDFLRDSKQNQTVTFRDVLHAIRVRSTTSLANRLLDRLENSNEFRELRASVKEFKTLGDK